MIRRWIAGLAMAGLAVVGVLSGMTASDNVQPAQAASLTHYVFGDTNSIIARSSAQDSAFKSGYDCCQFRSDEAADTTRWVLIAGAQSVEIVPQACDTCTTFRWTYSLQFANDTSATPQATIGTARAQIDSTGLSTGTAQVLLKNNTNGFARTLIVRPISTAAFDTETHYPSDYLKGYMRMIITEIFIGDDRPSDHRLRLDAYIQRDDMGDRWRTDGYTP